MKTTNKMQFKVLIEQDEDGIFVASVPEVEGCHTQGKTLEVARERIKEAINLCLESDPKLLEQKRKFPFANPTFMGIEDVYVQYA